MARLIDADALLKKAEMREHKLNGLRSAVHMCVAKWDIKNAPTIEAEPVRHGKWTYDFRYRRMAPVDAMLRCSECGLGSYVLIGEMYTYCPHCGAKMDGGNNEQERTD